MKVEIFEGDLWLLKVAVNGRIKYFFYTLYNKIGIVALLLVINIKKEDYEN